jgi:pilus assembly protein Flp/PilA
VQDDGPLVERRCRNLSRWGDTRGVTAIEYALLASLVAMAIVVAVYALSGAVGGLYDSLTTIFN